MESHFFVFFWAIQRSNCLQSKRSTFYLSLFKSLQAAALVRIGSFGAIRSEIQESLGSWYIKWTIVILSQCLFNRSFDVLCSEWSRISNPDWIIPVECRPEFNQSCLSQLVSSETHIGGILSLANGGWTRRQKWAWGPQRRRKKETGGTEKEGTRKTCKYIAFCIW